jgi:hypothetical protein
LLTRRSGQQEADAAAARIDGLPTPPVVTKMPKSFYGSKTHLHDEMHNALTLVRKIKLWPHSSMVSELISQLTSIGALLSKRTPASPLAVNTKGACLGLQARTIPKSNRAS